jgi:hypothetical protein
MEDFRMGDKVVVEGKLSNWQSSPLHVGISVNDPTVEGDWAALSGRQVRVTVEVVEPESTEGQEQLDRLKEQRCCHCGHQRLGITISGATLDESPAYAVYCKECHRTLADYKPSPKEAVDWYFYVYRPEPEPRCPFCGGKIKVEDESEVGIDYKITGFSAVCQECPALGCGPTRQAALDALAEWLAPCPRCGGKAEYRCDWYLKPYKYSEKCYSYWVVCANRGCGIRSPRCDSKPAAAQWWNEREGQHG